MVSYKYLFFVIIILCFHFGGSFILPGTRNGCKIQNGTSESRYCCSGYYEQNKSCHECIGSHGFNCTSPCPPSWYGALCRYKCSCPDKECDQVNGCTKEMSTVKFTPTDSGSKQKAYTFTIVGTDSPKMTTRMTTKFVHATFQNEKTSKIPQKFPSQENSTGTSLRRKFHEVIWTSQIRNWVVIFFIVLFAILATVIGVKMCQQKRERERKNLFNYKRLRSEKELDSKDYLFDGGYSDISMKTPVLTDCKI